jgi:hypothetical protein
MSDELNILLPEEAVQLPGGRRLTLRPWSLAQFARAAALVMEIIQALTPLGLTFDNAEEFLQERWPALLAESLPFFPRLIALNFPELEVEELDAGTQAALGLRILLKNGDSLKNFWALALGTPGTRATLP